MQFLSVPKKLFCGGVSIVNMQTRKIPMRTTHSGTTHTGTVYIVYNIYCVQYVLHRNVLCTCAEYIEHMYLIFMFTQLFTSLYLRRVLRQHNETFTIISIDNARI